MNDPEFSRSEKEIQAEILEETQVDGRRGGKAGLKWALLSVLLVMGVIAVAIGFGYRYWQELQSTLDRLDAAISAADEQQTDYRQQLQGMQRALESQQQQLAAEQARQVAQEGQQDQGQQQLEEERLRLQQQWVEMRDRLQAVPRSVVSRPNDAAWLSAEVEYLIQLASYRLLLTQDPGTAIQALETADRRLGEAGGPEWQAVRQSLAADISRLQAIALPDSAAVATRLTGLEQSVAGLSLMATKGVTEQPDADASAVAPLQERTFSTILRDGWDGLRSVLVIRHHDQPMRIGLPPEQQYFAYQNLQLQLAAARLALVRGDQRQYQASLQQVEQWLLEFFDPNSDNTKAFLSEIRDLRQVDLTPPLPDISGTLMALRERLRTGGEAGTPE